MITTYTKNCLRILCNKEFTTLDKRQKYCCIECAYADRKSTRKILVNCDFCGRELSIYSSRTVIPHHFCDRVCLGKWQSYCKVPHNRVTRHVVRINKRLAKVCEVCHRTYKPTYKEQRCCCNGCRLYDLNVTQVGELHSSWKGGVTPERRRLENVTTYKNWKKYVYKRDKYRCVMCGKTGRLEAHHIKTFADFPDLRTDSENGITLCHDCHLKTYGKESLFESYFLNAKSFFKEFYNTAEVRVVFI